MCKNIFTHGNREFIIATGSNRNHGIDFFIATTAQRLLSYRLSTE
nr:hypothetical protein [Photobacterium damselae]